MASKKCKTPGAFYWHKADNVGNRAKIEFSVWLPPGIKITQKKSRELEKIFHDTMEAALAPLFKDYEPPKIDEAEYRQSTYLRVN